MTAAVVLTLAWATFAFGAVYPWAYVPLLVACAAIGILGLCQRRPDTPRLVNAVPIWLAGVAAGVLLQLVPLPGGVLARISPATEAFIRTYQFSYASADPSAPLPALPWHPLSLDPAATWRALAFLVAFGLFLAGLARALTQAHVRSLARSLIALGLLLAVVGIAQKALGDHDLRAAKLYGFWKPQDFGNPFGPFVNRNHFAGWMLMALPLALGYFAAVLEDGLRHVRPGLRNRLLWLGSDRAGQSITVGFSILVTTEPA
jgi:hypothetical protein